MAPIRLAKTFAQETAKYLNEMIVATFRTFRTASSFFAGGAPLVIITLNAYIAAHRVSPGVAARPALAEWAAAD
jgi:hypothetical protein